MKYLFIIILALNFNLVTCEDSVALDDFSLRIIRSDIGVLHVERISLEELSRPGERFLASVKGEKPFSQEIRPLPTPTISPHEVLIVPLFSGVTGSDIDIFTGARDTPPGVMGHEVVAKVIQVGENVSGIKVGDIITMNPNNPRDPDDIIGFNGIGFFGRVFKIPARFVKQKDKTIFQIPTQLSFFNTLFPEMLATVHFAQDVIRDDIKNKTVVIVGAGPAGILHVMLAEQLGAKEIILIEKDKARLDRTVINGFIEPGRAIFADELTSQRILKLTEGAGADVVIIATSEFRTAQWALDYIADEAIINLYGKIKPGSKLKFKDGTIFDAYQFYKQRQPGQPQKETVTADGKKIKFVLTRGERGEDFVSSLQLLETDKINPFGIISHVISLEALPDVLRQLSDSYRLNGEVAHKVIIDMRLKGKVILSTDDYLQLFSGL